MSDPYADQDSAAFVPVVTLDEIPTSGMWAGTVGDHRVLICRSRGVYFALENLCSHGKAPLSRGRVKGDCIVCPVHGARFALADGRHLSPPASVGVRTFELRLSGEQIEIRPDPRDPPGGAAPRSMFF